MPYAYLCDFDGTISPADIGAELVRRFSARPDRETAALLERWRAGEIGHRELTVEEFRTVSVTEPEALEFTRGFGLDPGFAPFVAEARARGDRVAVVSEGLDFYVRDRLERAGLGELPWSANRARFERDRLIVDFPAAADGCGDCGNCKGLHVRRHQAMGFEVVLVGDGLSDRCGARAADRVLARGELLDWCRREGIAVEPFASFADVAACARRFAGTAAGGPDRDAAALGG